MSQLKRGYTIRVDQEVRDRLNYMARFQNTSAKMILRLLLHRLDNVGKPIVGNCIQCGRRIAFTWGELDGAVNTTQPSHTKQGSKCPIKKIT